MSNFDAKERILAKERVAVCWRQTPAHNTQFRIFHEAGNVLRAPGIASFRFSCSTLCFSNGHKDDKKKIHIFADTPGPCQVKFFAIFDDYSSMVDVMDVGEVGTSKVLSPEPLLHFIDHYLNQKLSTLPFTDHHVRSMKPRTRKRFSLTPCSLRQVLMTRSTGRLASVRTTMPALSLALVPLWQLLSPADRASRAWSFSRKESTI